MGFLPALFHHDREEVARLRDELIIARTGNVLLSGMLASLSRRREPRKDRSDIIAARKATTERLRGELLSRAKIATEDKGQGA